MTPQEMQKRSRDKVQQVMDLAKMLHLRVEARQRVNKATGFIENIVFWADDEKYPEAEQPKGAEDAAPVENPAEVPAEAPKQEDAA
jgi:hypothetical protein